MKKYIDFYKNNMELVTGITIILILSNFVILKIAFEKKQYFWRYTALRNTLCHCPCTYVFWDRFKEKNGIDYSFIEMLSTSIFIVLLMFGSVIIWLKLVAVIPLLEKGIFEVGNIFLCIIFIFGLILTLIGFIKFAYKDNERG